MKLSTISVAEYQHIAHDDAFDCTETIMLAGTWPISVGKHPDFDKPILIAHIEGAAILVTLDLEHDSEPSQ